MQWDKIFTNHLSDKGIIFKIDKELIQFNNKKIDNLIKMGTRPELKFFQRRHTNGLQVREKVLNITGQSNVLIIKITMRYYFISVMASIIKTTTDNKCWQGSRGKETLVYCRWERKLVQSLWEIV